MAATYSEQLYRLYLEFLETAETKRRWSIFTDIPWPDLNAAKANPDVRQSVEIFCAEELYVPDYSARGLDLSRAMFGSAWFQTCWAFEESRHGLVFREYLTRSGLYSEGEFATLEAGVFAREWRLPFTTMRQMACYGALQEGATFSAYKAQRDRARNAGDKVLEAIFFYVGRDEAAHAGFYRAVIALELARDRASTIADLAYVLSRFQMPGDGLIPDYQERLRTSGAGISPRAFLERVVAPLTKTLGTSRQELKDALKQASAERLLENGRARAV
ncbi:MAG: acyl-ACP desaturase [Candidatus Binataceae bacterium]